MFTKRKSFHVTQAHDVTWENDFHTTAIECTFVLVDASLNILNVNGRYTIVIPKKTKKILLKYTRWGKNSILISTNSFICTNL